MSSRKFLVAANWKMNGTLDSSKKLVDGLIGAQLDEKTGE